MYTILEPGAKTEILVNLIGSFCTSQRENWRRRIAGGDELRGFPSPAYEVWAGVLAVLVVPPAGVRVGEHRWAGETPPCGAKTATGETMQLAGSKQGDLGYS